MPADKQILPMHFNGNGSRSLEKNPQMAAFSKPPLHSHWKALAEFGRIQRATILWCDRALKQDNKSIHLSRSNAKKMSLWFKPTEPPGGCSKAWDHKSQKLLLFVIISLWVLVAFHHCLFLGTFFIDFWQNYHVHITKTTYTHRFK